MDTPPPTLGTIGWADVTIPNADDVRDFYAAVVGWTFEGLDMGGYADYVMKAADGKPVAGVCHARGVNADLPPVWLLYVHVTDLEASLGEVAARGGRVVSPARSAGGGRIAVVADPAGAVLALYQAAG
jgi:predicted enzyme related to lactoylglutathione lyase